MEDVRTEGARLMSCLDPAHVRGLSISQTELEASTTGRDCGLGVSTKSGHSDALRGKYGVSN